MALRIWSRQPLVKASEASGWPTLAMPRGKFRGLLAVGVLLVVGAGLRLAPLGQASLHLGLPWASPPTLTLYFPDSQGRFLVPVARRVDSAEATPQGAIQHLLRGPRGLPGLGAVFPNSQGLAGFDLQQGVATVRITGDASPLAREAVARTLAAFPEVKEVQPAEGSAQGMVVAPSHPLYYVYGPYVVAWGAATSPDEALRHYLAGPPAGSGLEGLPADVRLVEYRLDAHRGLAYVNFTYTESVRMVALADPVRMRRILTGVIATLTSFPEVKAVKLDFQGHAQLGLGQCSDLLRAPQPRPTTLNDESRLAR